MGHRGDAIDIDLGPAVLPAKLNPAIRTPRSHPTDRSRIPAWPPVLLLILAWTQRVNPREERITGTSSTITRRTMSAPTNTHGHFFLRLALLVFTVFCVCASIS
jgi:hypothetical protein